MLCWLRNKIAERDEGGRLTGRELDEPRCIPTQYGSYQVWKRCTAKRHQPALLDANHCWQRGGKTPPIQVSEPAVSQEAVADWNWNSGSYTSEGGSVSLCPLVSVYAYPAVLYYCHFLFALTHHHSCCIITFKMFSSEMCKKKMRDLQSILHRFKLPTV